MPPTTVFVLAAFVFFVAIGDVGAQEASSTAGLIVTTTNPYWPSGSRGAGGLHQQPGDHVSVAPNDKSQGSAAKSLVQSKPSSLATTLSSGGPLHSFVDDSASSNSGIPAAPQPVFNNNVKALSQSTVLGPLRHSGVPKTIALTVASPNSSSDHGPPGDISQNSGSQTTLKIAKVSTAFMSSETQGLTSDFLGVSTGSQIRTELASSSHPGPKGHGTHHAPAAGSNAVLPTTTMTKLLAEPVPGPDAIWPNNTALPSDALGAVSDSASASPGILFALESAKHSSGADSSSIASPGGAVSSTFAPSGKGLTDDPLSTSSPAQPGSITTLLSGSPSTLGGHWEGSDNAHTGDKASTPRSENNGYQTRPGPSESYIGKPSTLTGDPLGSPSGVSSNLDAPGSGTAISTMEHSLGGLSSDNPTSRSATANRASPSTIEFYSSPGTDDHSGAPILSKQNTSTFITITSPRLDGFSTDTMSAVGSTNASPTESIAMPNSRSSSPSDDLLATRNNFSSPTSAFESSTPSTPQLSVLSGSGGVVAGTSATIKPSHFATSWSDSGNSISVASTIGAAHLMSTAEKWQTPSISTTINSITLIEPLSTTANSMATEATTGASSPASQLPESIAPADGPQQIPINAVLIQLGFNEKLPYRFVATTPLSSSQIFLYVPQGLEYALQDAKDKVSMFAIRPYDNAKYTGYIATVALAYIPVDQKDILRAMIHNPYSRLYGQNKKAVRTLMSMVDPSIPLDVDGPDASSTGNVPTGGSHDGGNGGNGSTSSNGPAGASASHMPGARTSSVGISVGAVAGAAAYGAGMFWIARRYRRRQSHQRLGSNVDISAPVMTENSLGWELVKSK